MPKQALYDDEFAKTFDLEWMYKIQRVVKALHAAGTGLQRASAPCNANLPA